MIDDPHLELFHYTDTRGFLGILGSRSMWATNARYLNDEQELLHGLSKARELLDHFASRGTTEEKERVRLYSEAIAAHKSVDVFVISFSEERNLLSQWRAYGDWAGSYAIGFRAQVLERIGTKAGFVLRPCVYAKNKQERVLLTFLVEELRRRMPSQARSGLHSGQKRWAFAIRFVERLYRVLATIKHPGFDEEKEWRLVSGLAQEQDPSLYRVGAVGLTPYVTISFAGYPKPLTNVVIGPARDVDLAEQTARAFVADAHYEFTSVYRSGIPFRHPLRRAT